MQQVLLVDDEPLFLSMFATILERAGYTVQEASDGSQALRLISESAPDLIISDLMMPGLDGIELCEEIRANPQMKSIPFVLLTAISDRERHQIAMNRGVTRVLTKPILPQVLSQEVHTALAQSTHLS